MAAGYPAVPLRRTRLRRPV